jgi:hypothetical protein
MAIAAALTEGQGLPTFGRPLFVPRPESGQSAESDGPL